ncbi:MAG: hypothetical protein VX764_10290 [Planctomycetota bacterium]|nr:hypothetical protein [Planctomycetota bacterium]
MSAIIFTTWISLLLPLPQSAESVLPAGDLPVGVLLSGWGLLTEQQLISESSTLGHRSFRLLEPLSLTRGGEILVRGLLRSEGIELQPIHRGLVLGPHWATTRPDAKPPLARFEVRVIRLLHVNPEPICELLREEARKRETDLGPLDRHSRFVPDPRTGSVVISCTSAIRLQHYLKLLSAADRPPVAGTHRPVLRSWRVRHGTVNELAIELDRAWKRRGGVPLHVVEHLPSNSLMIRLPKHIWPTVEQLLEQLDPAPSG